MRQYNIAFCLFIIIFLLFFYYFLSPSSSLSLLSTTPTRAIPVELFQSSYLSAFGLLTRSYLSFIYYEDYDDDPLVFDRILVSGFHHPLELCGSSPSRAILSATHSSSPTQALPVLDPFSDCSPPTRSLTTHSSSPSRAICLPPTRAIFRLPQPIISQVVRPINIERRTYRKTIAISVYTYYSYCNEECQKQINQLKN